MQLTLSEADLAKMPPELRRSLMQFIAGAEPAAAGAPVPATPLAPAQVTALLREASFHRDGAALHALLKRLAYREESETPTRQTLARALPDAARKSLPRHLATLNRLAARIAKERGAKLWHHRRADDSYAVPPATREALRDLLPVLARSGKQEEPLWEGPSRAPPRAR